MSQVFLIALPHGCCRFERLQVGFVLASLMVVLGLLVATDLLARHFAPPSGNERKSVQHGHPHDHAGLPDAHLFRLPQPLQSNRFNPTAHKRLILIATIAILDEAAGNPGVETGGIHRYKFVYIRFSIGIKAAVRAPIYLAHHPNAGNVTSPIKRPCAFMR
jgi:hypothetical protein